MRLEVLPRAKTPIAVTLTSNIKRIRGDKGDERAVARRRRWTLHAAPTGAPVDDSASG